MRDATVVGARTATTDVCLTGGAGPVRTRVDMPCAHVAVLALESLAGTRARLVVVRVYPPSKALSKSFT